MDERRGAATDWVTRITTVTFSPPRGLSEDGQAERVADLVDAVTRALPRLPRAQLLERLDAARRWLLEHHQTQAWPTVNEVIRAIRETERAEREGGTGGWPHRNSEMIIAAAARWIEKFGEWPEWLEWPDAVAKELLARGLVGEAELRAAGFQGRIGAAS